MAQHEVIQWRKEQIERIRASPEYAACADVLASQCIRWPNPVDECSPRLWRAKVYEFSEALAHVRYSLNKRRYYPESVLRSVREKCRAQTKDLPPCLATLREPLRGLVVQPLALIGPRKVYTLVEVRRICLEEEKLFSQ